MLLCLATICINNGRQLISAHKQVAQYLCSVQWADYSDNIKLTKTHLLKGKQSQCDKFCKLYM